MEVPRLGVESDLQLPAYATATATPDLSRICDPHHSSRQHQILNPLCEARDRTHNLMVPSQIHFLCASREVLIVFRVVVVFCLFVLGFFFLGPHPWHIEVPRLGVEEEL